jgi:hypothetical protein
VVVATLYSLDAPVEARFVEFFEGHIRPRFEEAGGRLLAYFVTEPAANNFPRLPVREGEHVFVWFASFASEAEYAAHVCRARCVERLAWNDGRNGRLAERAARSAEAEAHAPVAHRELKWLRRIRTGRVTSIF